MSTARIGKCGGCFATKRLVARSLCSSCYQAQTRAGKEAVDTVMKRAERLEHAGKTLIECAAEAKQELTRALPDAARFLIKAAEVAAARGNSKPAEAILREFPASEDGKNRILQSQFSAGQQFLARGQDGATRIFIGVTLGGQKRSAELPETVDAQHEAR